MVIIKNKFPLKFRIIIRKQYLAILHTGCKMVIIKNKESQFY